MPTRPLDLDVILSEFDESRTAWVLAEDGTGQYVVVPDPRFPGRRPVRFFMRREDAEAMLTEILDVNPGLRDKEIYPREVPLLESLRSIAANTDPVDADSFVVHTPNEVYDFVRENRP